MNDAWLRFDAATNPYGPSPKVREALAAFARTGDFSRYDDEERAESLRGDLAAHWGLSPDHFIVYNGSGEAVVWLFFGAVAARAAASAHSVSVVRALCGVGAAVCG